MRTPQKQSKEGASAERDKLIRLHDLIPKKDVEGGRQLLFGVTETKQTK